MFLCRARFFLILRDFKFTKIFVRRVIIRGENLRDLHKFRGRVMERKEERIEVHPAIR